MRMKYVKHKTKGFFLFPDSDSVWHSHVGEFLGTENIQSAGFVRMRNGTPECYGSSESLNKSSAPSDSEQLKTQMGIR